MIHNVQPSPSESSSIQTRCEGPAHLCTLDSLITYDHGSELTTALPTDPHSSSFSGVRSSLPTFLRQGWPYFLSLPPLAHLSTFPSSYYPKSPFSYLISSSSGPYPSYPPHWAGRKSRCPSRQRNGIACPYVCVEHRTSPGRRRAERQALK